MKKLLLIGAGEAHAAVLYRLARQPAANADITLACPSAMSLRSAMLPGHVAGHYSRARIEIDLADTARTAGVTVVPDRVIVIDADARMAVTVGGRELEFDFASIDVGAATLAPEVPGVARFALLTRPAAVFLQGWARVCELALEGVLTRLTVVGGGSEAVELMLAMHHGLKRVLPAPAFAACGFSIVTAGLRLLESLPEPLGLAAEAICLARGISLLRGAAVVEVACGSVNLSNGARLVSDITVWAAARRGARWLEASGLECDPRGLLRVDANLRSLSSRRVYAAGSCRAVEIADAAGARGARDAAQLAANLRHALAGAPPPPLPPTRDPIEFVSLGTRRALATRGAAPVDAPAWLLWRYKDWLDRRATGGV